MLSPNTKTVGVSADAVEAAVNGTIVRASAAVAKTDVILNFIFFLRFVEKFI